MVHVFEVTSTGNDDVMYITQIRSGTNTMQHSKLVKIGFVHDVQSVRTQIEGTPASYRLHKIILSTWETSGNTTANKIGDLVRAPDPLPRHRAITK